MLWIITFSCLLFIKMLLWLETNDWHLSFFLLQEVSCRLKLIRLFIYKLFGNLISTLLLCCHIIFSELCLNFGDIIIANINFNLLYFGYNIKDILVNLWNIPDLILPLFFWFGFFFLYRFRSSKCFNFLNFCILFNLFWERIFDLRLFSRKLLLKRNQPTKIHWDLAIISQIFYFSIFFLLILFKLQKWMRLNLNFFIFHLFYLLIIYLLCLIGYIIGLFCFHIFQMSLSQVVWKLLLLYIRNSINVLKLSLSVPIFVKQIVITSKFLSNFTHKM